MFLSQSLKSEKNSLEKDLQSKKEYLTKLEFKLTSKAPFSTRREHVGTYEKEAKTQELLDLEEELKKKIKKFDRMIAESEEKIKDEKKYNSKELIRVKLKNNLKIYRFYMDRKIMN